MAKDFKGFGVKPSSNKVKKTFPLVISLQQKLQLGELVVKQSSTWDWLESLTAEENQRLIRLRDSDTVDGTAELILLVVHLLQMETGIKPHFTESKIKKLLGVLTFVSAAKELVDAGLIEIKGFSGRLSDADSQCEIRLLGGEI